jgi:hypothetical protein
VRAKPHGTQEGEDSVELFGIAVGVYPSGHPM